MPLTVRTLTQMVASLLGDMVLPVLTLRRVRGRYRTLLHGLTSLVSNDDEIVIRIKPSGKTWILWRLR